MSNRRFLFAGLVLALLLAGVVSFYASASPDGLEKVATDHGIVEKARDHDLSASPFAEYGTRGIGNERLSGGVAGIAGVGITLACAGGLAYVLRRRSPSSRP